MLQTIDDLWADYLAAVADLRADSVWISLGAANPFANYIVQVHAHVRGSSSRRSTTNGRHGSSRR